MPHAIAIAAPGPIASAAHTLTPAQLGLLCDRAAELPPGAVRLLLAELAGAHEAVALFTGGGGTYARLSALLGELEVKFPKMDAMDGKDTTAALPGRSAFSVQPSVV